MCLDLSQGRSPYKQATLRPDGYPEQEATAEIAFVCSPIVKWEQTQTFDQDTLTSSCCLNPALFPR